MVEDSTKFINGNAPAEDTLSIELGHFVGQILVVTVDKNVITEEQGAEGAKGFDNGKEFLFNGCHVSLG